jgi:hypothetical protein
VPEVVFELVGDLMSQDKGQSVIPMCWLTVTGIQHAFGQDDPAIGKGNRQGNAPGIALDDQ